MAVFVVLVVVVVVAERLVWKRREQQKPMLFIHLARNASRSLSRNPAHQPDGLATQITRFATQPAFAAQPSQPHGLESVRPLDTQP